MGILADKGYAMRFFVLVFLCCALYCNTFPNEFVWDDNMLITGNRYIRNYRNIPLFFTPRYWNTLHPRPGQKEFRPVRTTTFAVDYTLWQMDPRGYHGTNLLLHTANTFLVYLLLGSLIRISGKNKADSAAEDNPWFGLPFLAALLFAAHPIHTESVSYIKNRSELLGCLFFLLAFRCFIQTTTANKRIWQTMFYPAGWFCFILAIFSKETALVLPAILMLYAVCFLSEKNRGAAFRQTIFFWAIALLFGWFRETALIALPATGNTAALGLWQTVLTACQTMGYYLYLLFLPISMNVEHVFSPPVSLLGPAVLLPALAISLLGLMMIFSYRRSSWLCFSAGWMLVTILPAANLIYLSSRPIAEQRLYLPSLGVCLLLSLAIRSISSRRKRFSGRGNLAAISVLAVILLFYSVQTVSRNRDWRSSLALWQDCLRKTPHQTRPHTGLAAVYMSRNDYARAIKHYRLVLKTILKAAGDEHLDTATACSNLSMALAMNNQPEAALHYCQQALAIREKQLGPDNIETADCYLNLGVIFSRKNQPDPAVQMFQRALTVYRNTFGPDHPDIAKTLTGLGTVSYRQNDWDQALLYYRQALAVHRHLEDNHSPAAAQIYHNLGGVWHKIGCPAEAMENYRRALIIRLRTVGIEHPQTAATLYNMGLMYYDHNQLAKSQEFLGRAFLSYKKAFGQNHPRTANAEKRLQAVRQKMDRAKP